MQRSPRFVAVAVVVAGALIALGGLASASAGPLAVSATSPVSWCCANGTDPGLTVTGQATVHGQGTAARTTAIARAVADAKAQADAAASAAGISLGAIVSMQVDAPYPYAVPLSGIASAPAEAAPGAPNTAAAAGSATSGAASGSATAVCPFRAPRTPVGIAAQTYASVTITWAIA